MSTKLGAVLVERQFLPPGDHDVEYENAEIIAGAFNRDAIRWTFVSGDGMICSKVTGTTISPGTKAGDLANILAGKELVPGELFDAGDYAGKSFRAVIVKGGGGATSVEILPKE